MIPACTGHFAVTYLLHAGTAQRAPRGVALCSAAVFMALGQS